MIFFYLLNLCFTTTLTDTTENILVDNFLTDTKNTKRDNRFSRMIPFIFKESKNNYHDFGDNNYTKLVSNENDIDCKEKVHIRNYKRIESINNKNDSVEKDNFRSLSRNYDHIRGVIG
ncbi:putative SP-containing protein [Vairimorpha necatrix]|uniref:SP-containing protein n=1 Tax=Vairimorpha necatrix TaxID=6039 RepID=A0AAX4JB89_9MICR